MNCCPNCFNSQHIKDLFTANKIFGDCDFCKSRNVQIADPKTLGVFKNLIDEYVLNNDNTIKGFVASSTLQIQITADFGDRIFAFGDVNLIESFLKEVIADDLGNYANLFIVPVILAYKLSVSNAASEDLKISWNNFASEIKNENRFHIRNTLDLNLLSKLLGRHSRTQRNGKTYFRARISGKDGYDCSQMGNPLPTKSRSGRANPSGISYLYLSNDIETTLYETRAALYDFVCVAEFELLEDIKIISLSQTDNYDPMQLADSDDLSEFLIYLPFIQAMEGELAKPIRRNDSEIDYLPTQYLCEFIKSLGYDGVEYRSSLNVNGFNFAIFNPSKFKCNQSNVHEVKKISFEYNRI